MRASSPGAAAAASARLFVPASNCAMCPVQVVRAASSLIVFQNGPAAEGALSFQAATPRAIAFSSDVSFGP